MVKIRLCPNLSCTRVRKYNELHKFQNFTLVIRDYVRDVSFYEQCMIQLYKNLMKFLDQDYTFIKWFYDNLQNFQRSFRYYYHYFIIRLQVEVWLIPSKHLKFSNISMIWTIIEQRYFKYIFEVFFGYYLRYI